MSDSLKDQLLALGLAKEKPKRKPQDSKRNSANPGSRRSSGNQKSTGEFSLAKAYALKKQDERKQADQARKKKLAEDRKRRLLNNEIRKIVNAHRLNQGDAEIPRNFMYRGRIRKIHVNPGQLTELNAGKLGIAYLSGGYHLLAKEHIEAVRQLSREHVVDLGSGTGDDGDHPVPDDISW